MPVLVLHILAKIKNDFEGEGTGRGEIPPLSITNRAIWPNLRGGVPSYGGVILRMLMQGSTCYDWLDVF